MILNILINNRPKTSYLQPTFFVFWAVNFIDGNLHFNSFTPVANSVFESVTKYFSFNSFMPEADSVSIR